jgi:hypothetical protein
VGRGARAGMIDRGVIDVTAVVLPGQPVDKK